MARNTSGGYRLLILDGHNSHTTYRFCSFAERHKIVVLCLPSHTTHHLQPCDVGVFGPLAASWKAEVNETSSSNIPIWKNNLLYYYSWARKKAFLKTTIKNAFRKTGIWPFDRNAIEKDAFAPALNTTTQAALPVVLELPMLLVPILPPARAPAQVVSPAACTLCLVSLQPAAPPVTILPTANPLCATSTGQSSLSPSLPPSTATILSTTLSDNITALMSAVNIQEYDITGLPFPPTSRITRDELLEQNRHLQELLDKACFQMERDHALKKLMEKENENLWHRLFHKTNKPKKKLASGNARHMTGNEHLQALARDEWEAKMKELLKNDIFKQRRVAYDRYCREQAASAKELERSQKAEERLWEKERKVAEKAIVQEE